MNGPVDATDARRRGEDELQQELRDLLSLAVVGDHLRFVLTGDDAAELAGWLEGAVAEWRAWAGRLAQALAASGVPPDGRVRSLARDIPLNWVPGGWLTAEEGRRLLAERLTTITEWTGYLRSQATAPRVELLGVVHSGLQAQQAAIQAASDASSPTTAP